MTLYRKWKGGAAGGQTPVQAQMITELMAFPDFRRKKTRQKAGFMAERQLR
jgi:hypothetical protein